MLTLEPPPEFPPAAVSFGVTRAAVTPLKLPRAVVLSLAFSLSILLLPGYGLQGSGVPQIGIQGQADTIAPSAPPPSGSPRKLHTGSPEPQIHDRISSTGVAYVGPESCAQCHRPIFDEFTRTPMGQSMSLPGQRAELREVSSEVKVFDDESGRYYAVSRKGDDFYQSEFALDSTGAETYRDSQRLAYAVGSGLGGIGFLIDRGGYLFEAPLSYYSTSHRWELSPGFERGQLGFARPIVPTCLYCHSGRPRPATEDTNLYRNPPFHELAIGCENCHGPGQLHEEERRKALPIRNGIDTSIVNPARLPPWLADDICMGCHEFGSARVAQPGKSYLDFRPGTPLIDTVAIFNTDFRPGSKLLEVASEVALSKCYRSSEGRFGCLSCHDPHRWPTAQEAPAFYRARCLNCHQDASCRLSLAKRQSLTPADNCIACHMPKRSVPEFRSHGVGITTHRVILQPDEPYPEVAASTAPGDLILADAPPGAGRITSPPLVLLQAYHAIIQSHPDQAYKDRYQALLAELSTSEPDNLVVSRYVGEDEVAKRTPEGLAKALKCFSKAVDLGSKAPSDYLALAELLARAGRTEEAAAVLARGIESTPYVAQLYEALAVRDWQTAHYSAASQVVERGLRLFPGDSFLRRVEDRLQSMTAPN